MKQRYRIAFLTYYDPADKQKLSGSSYYIMKTLQKYVGDVTNLGPVEIGNAFFGYLNRFFKLFPKPYNLNHSYFYSYFYSRVFKRKLAGRKYDFIFAPRGSTQIALLKTEIPIIYYTDTTFKSMYNYYSWFSNFLKLSEIEGNSIERKALNIAKSIIFSSSWAANSAINDYQIPQSKVNVVPLGPNVDYIPTSDEIKASKGSTICKLLFIGVEWERKGGKIAFDTLIELKRKGIKSTLTIVGVKPPPEFRDKDMKVISFLNKNHKTDSDKFNKLLLDSHFLILPTREECFGVVFCEASAYGLPSLAARTGGVATAIAVNKNGFLFELSDGGKEYANKIAELFLDYNNKYLPLSINSRRYYDEVLNWESFGNSILKIVDSLNLKNKGNKIN